jgi:DNA-binding response OmpR family regulator
VKTAVLLADDDTELSGMLAEYLGREGFAVTAVHDGDAAARLALEGGFEIVVLDVMMPRVDGIEALRRIRASSPPLNRMPVVMLTARGDDIDRIIGLEIGADDYVTKPFSTLELVARVRAVLRRAAVEAPPPVRERFGAIEIDSGTRLVRRAGQPVSLTPKEFDLLALLLRRDGNVVTRTELLSEVWGYEDPAVLTRTIDIHVAELRRKLEDDPSAPRHILTVRKVGYRLVRAAPE